MKTSSCGSKKIHLQLEKRLSSSAVFVSEELLTPQPAAARRSNNVTAYHSQSISSGLSFFSKNIIAFATKVDTVSQCSETIIKKTKEKMKKKKSLNVTVLNAATTSPAYSADGGYGFISSLSPRGANASYTTGEIKSSVHFLHFCCNLMGTTQ